MNKEQFDLLQDAAEMIKNLQNKGYTNSQVLAVMYETGNGSGLTCPQMQRFIKYVRDNSSTVDP